MILANDMYTECLEVKCNEVCNFDKHLRISIDGWLEDWIDRWLVIKQIW